VVFLFSLFHGEFRTEFASLDRNVQTELIATLKVLGSIGPSLGRPHADTLSGSKFANMKGLRFYAGNGVWRVAFAFDPRRQAIVLVAGDKVGGSQERFYKPLIAKADARFTDHLATLKG
jgi:hypothetical protein